MRSYPYIWVGLHSDNWVDLWYCIEPGDAQCLGGAVSFAKCVIQAGALALAQDLGMRAGIDLGIAMVLQKSGRLADDGVKIDFNGV